MEALASVLKELKSREPIFHHPEFGSTRTDFEKMMSAEFWEVGASGRRYSRDYVLQELDRRSANPAIDEWEITDFECRWLAAEVYLVTYLLVQQRTRQTRRSTLWQQTQSGWKILYHQGTIIEDAIG